MFEPSPGFNLITGTNGSGKTSLLEAIYLLGRGQSFRSSGTRDLIQDGQDDCLVRALLYSPTAIPIGIRKSSQETQTRLGQQRDAALSELARHCPTLVIEPGQHRLLEDGPRLRRRYLDWSVFHVERTYQSNWMRFQRALRQRNSLLRQGDSTARSAWDKEYVQSAEVVTASRQVVFEQLAKSVEEYLPALLPGSEVPKLSYQRGWTVGRELSECLAASRALDQSRGFSQYGPHRAEIRISRSRQSAKHRLSRGQQKMLVAAMVLAQASHFHAARGIWPVLLVDDFGSELSVEARGRFLDRLRAYPGQVFLTTLDPEDRPGPGMGKMFHVKHGAVTAVL